MRTLSTILYIASGCLALLAILGLAFMVEIADAPISRSSDGLVEIGMLFAGIVGGGAVALAFVARALGKRQIGENEGPSRLRTIGIWIARLGGLAIIAVAAIVLFDAAQSLFSLYQSSVEASFGIVFTILMVSLWSFGIGAIPGAVLLLVGRKLAS